MTPASSGPIASSTSWSPDVDSRKRTIADPTAASHPPIACGGPIHDPPPGQYLGPMRKSLLVVPALLVPCAALALSRERYTNATPYGIFFNNYDPNFYTGFMPRVQEKERIKIHLGRGNQVRLRMVLSEQTIDNYITDQVARHDLYKELIDKGIITLTTNTAWEDYDKKFKAEGLADLAQKKGGAN